MYTATSEVRCWRLVAPFVMIVPRFNVETVMCSFDLTVTLLCPQVSPSWRTALDHQST